MTEPQPQTCSREFPGTVEAASEAENWVARQASAFGIGEEAEFAIGLCLEELFLNAVQHGRANYATISVCAEPNGVVVEFADDGEPFDPTLAPAKRINGPDRGFRHRRLRRRPHEEILPAHALQPVRGHEPPHPRIRRLFVMLTTAGERSV